jgi:dihydrolipoamide dehydrogenase
LKKKGTIVTGLTKGIEGLFAKNKVDYLKGTGKFTGVNQITVEQEGGQSKVVTAKNTIIATGSEPTPFPNLPFDEKIIISSTGALQLQKIPKKLVVVGGGVIGVEMASVYSRLGTDVTVIEYFDKICPFLDGDLGTQF